MQDNHFILTNLLSEDEKKIIMSITSHIKLGEKRVGIQQIARENFLSSTYIINMCKRLGFDGYSELYYNLSRQIGSSQSTHTDEVLKNLVDNYSDEMLQIFCTLLSSSKDEKMFTAGEGFSNIVVNYIAQRLSICGFMVFNNVHFYDYMLFGETRRSKAPESAPIMFAVSQSGETGPVINDVRHARQEGYKIITFTRRDNATLARLSDLTFIIDGTKQTLAGSLPNPFFGHVILTFEELMAHFFDKSGFAE